MGWLAKLMRADDPDFPVSVLRILSDGKPLSPRESAVGLAAGEVVAASCGVASADLPGKERSWLEGTGARADSQALQVASRVAGAILDQHAGSPGEHEESGDSLASWLASVEDLRHRSARPSLGRPCKAAGVHRARGGSWRSWSPSGPVRNPGPAGPGSGRVRLAESARWRPVLGQWPAGSGRHAGHQRSARARKRHGTAAACPAARMGPRGDMALGP